MKEIKGNQITETITTRFRAKVQKPTGEPEACWSWSAGTNSKGYGIFTIKYPATELAHRFSYQCEKGEIAEGYVVRQICKNRLCVNPSHLKLIKASDVKAGQKFTDKQKKKIFEYYKIHNWAETLVKYKISNGLLGNIVKSFKQD